jgi:hypothetical protein
VHGEITGWSHLDVALAVDADRMAEVFLGAIGARG